MYRKNFMGLESFTWFIGVVENRIDPLNMNRVQIRCFGWHTDNKINIPTSDLPWAQPLLPINGAMTSASPKEGDMVVGFFTDGPSGQFPIIFGVLPGIPDTLLPATQGFSDPRTDAQLKKSPKKPAKRTYTTNGSGVTITEGSAKRYPDTLNEPTTSRVARNENISTTLIQERKDNVDLVAKEPTTKYAPVFPYNKVTETESGHLFEIDDTPGAERLSTTHRSGTFEEVHPDGSKVTKVVKNNYQVIMSDDNVHIMGNCNLTIQGNLNTKVLGDYNLDIFGTTNIRHEGNYNVYYGGDTLTRKKSGRTDKTCPSDTRNGASDCSNVPGL